MTSLYHLLSENLGRIGKDQWLGNCTGTDSLGLCWDFVKSRFYVLEEKYFQEWIVKSG